MKLLVLSDLHLENAPSLEIQRDAAQSADVIVLAGDIHPAPDGIIWARRIFDDKPIVYVAGNHEYFDCEFEAALVMLRQSAKEHDVHFLENDSVTIQGIRFLGCTLWTDFEFYGLERKQVLMEMSDKRFRLSGGKTA
jgi:predicted phosphodiesterase